MSITQFSIRHHVAVLVFCFAALVIGWQSYVQMPRESFPEVEFPYVLVSTFLDGANPTDVEESVTIPIETELDGIEGLKEMNSSSQDSLSIIMLEFHPNVDIESALRRVKDAVDQAKPDIAEEAEESVVKEMSFTSVPVLVYHLVGTEAITVSELEDMAEDIEDQLTTLPGVLDIDIFGGREREVIIEVDPDRLHFYDLTLSQVQGLLRGTNRNVSAGDVEGPSNRIVVRVPGEFDTPGDILELVIGFTNTGTPIYLRDVGIARYDFEDEQTRSRIYDLRAEDGEHSLNEYRQALKSVSINIKKRTGANILTLAEDVRDILEARPPLEGVRIIKGTDQSKMVRMMVADLENGIGTSLVLVLLVIFIGLGFRNALLVASAVPLSMLISIAILKMAGVTLNMMVLFSLILALGMLVDNAIVIVENIYRHMSMGASRAKAAVLGTGEVAWPVITSTATTVGAFLPLVFWPGIMGEFMSFLPRTVIVVLLSSLFVALVINPALAAMFMKTKGGVVKVDPELQRPDYWVVRRYREALEFLLDRPVWTILSTVVLLVFTLVCYAAFGAGTELFPPVDPDFTHCSISPPDGVSLDESDRLSTMMEDRIMGKPGSGYDAPVQNIKTANVTTTQPGTGGGGMGAEGIGPVYTMIEFVDREYRTESTMETLKELRNRIEGLDKAGERVELPLYGADFDVIKPQEGPPTGKPVSIDVFGENLNEMTRVIQDMKRIMRDTAGTVKPTDNAVTAQPTLEWNVDLARAGMVGLEQNSVASMIQMAVGGLKTGTLGHGDDEQDIKLRFPETMSGNTDRLSNMTIPGPVGNAVPLGAVAAAELVPGPVTIHRFDQKRMLNAAAELQPGIRNDADIRKAFQDKVSEYPFPAGMTHRFGGAAEEEESAKAFLGEAFMIALFIIVVVMVLQFNSLVVTGIVMCSVVLSLMGVFAGLLILQVPFGIIMTGVGVISLAGVVVNNAIVLLDAIRQFEARGVPTRDAVVSASMIRFRPVLLTAITTILGLVPMALKINWDFSAMSWQYDTTSSQWWQSMATSVIFGLLVATVLTLGIVPTLYMAYENLRFRVDAFLNRSPAPIGAHDPGAPTAVPADAGASPDGA